MNTFLPSFFTIIITFCTVFLSYGQKDVVEDNLNTQKNLNPDDQIVTKIIYGIGGPFQSLKPTDEDISLRTPTGKYFRAENGTMQAIIGAGNVHYQENGKWKTILSNIFSNTTGKHTDLAFSAP